MADWKQIQGRIRRARTSADPAAQLAKLYEKTRDAMAAFELARHLEGAGQPAEAARWYVTAAERFRRADWKKKAEEAAARLGGGEAYAPSQAESQLEPLPSEPVSFAPFAPGEMTAESGTPVPMGEPFAVAPEEGELVTVEKTETAGSAESVAAPGKKRRRRGRRGGRNRHRGREGTPAGRPVQAAAPEPEEVREQPRAAAAAAEARTYEAPRTPTSEATGPGIRGRSGDPALASRIAHLEMQLRRMLASVPVRVEDADRAPAGPGVFVVTDSDQITYYYVEACATLRIGIGKLLRNGGARRGEESLKARFADHLGIPESRVSKYVNEHCVVRWLQLDEGASGFAHFAIAVLRPVLND